MPKIMKKCARVGCSVLVPTGTTYCPPCDKEAARKREAKRAGRVNPYLTPRWRKYRKDFLKRHPTCSACHQAPATHVDHRVPARRAPNLFWEPSNHVGLCHSCHSRKTAAHDGGFGNPTSSKSLAPAPVSTGGIALNELAEFLRKNRR